MVFFVHQVSYKQRNSRNLWNFTGSTYFDAYCRAAGCQSAEIRLDKMYRAICNAHSVVADTLGLTRSRSRSLSRNHCEELLCKASYLIERSRNEEKDEDRNQSSHRNNVVQYSTILIFGSRSAMFDYECFMFILIGKQPGEHYDGSSEICTEFVRKRSDRQ